MKNFQRKTIIPNNFNQIKKISTSRKNHIKKHSPILTIPKLAISFMIHTASTDDFLKNKGINSYFESLTYCLSKQLFKNFELIYIDTFYEDNKEKFSKIISDLSFQVKHVSVHHQHRYWYDKGYTYISAAKNTGILYADGELCVTCDDGEFFPNNFLKLYWEEYERGRLMLALHKRLRNIETDNGKIVFPINGDKYINDSRFDHVKSTGYKIHKFGSLAYAGSSFCLKDALLLNGFNEKMDGCKSLEDCEFGTRLSIIGKTFSMFEEGFLYILEHQSYSNNVPSNDAPNNDNKNTNVELKRKKISNLIAIENYAMIQCAQKLMDIKANKSPITEKHIEIIKQETIKYRKFDPTDNEHIDNFKIWLECPNFDLEQQRKELRESEMWIWKK